MTWKPICCGGNSGKAVALKNSALNARYTALTWRTGWLKKVRFGSQDTRNDVDKFQILWNCNSEEEIRLKAAALGIDADAWLDANGFRWRQSFMWARIFQSRGIILRRY